MGWLYMQSFKGHSGPKQYLDNQYTWERPDRRSRVLKSACRRNSVYYAAVETVAIPSGERKVWAAVCLYKHNPLAADGYIFGYKDMDEGYGPYECECPAAILDSLTPTDSEYAIAWRARCRAYLAKPRLRPGHILVFEKPLRFSDGASHARFEATTCPWSPRTMLFRALDTGVWSRISRVMDRQHRLVDPQADRPTEPSVPSYA